MYDSFVIGGVESGFGLDATYLSETADHEDCVDFLVCRGDLPADETDDFLDYGLENLGYLGACHAEFATADALGWVVC